MRARSVEECNESVWRCHVSGNHGCSPLQLWLSARRTLHEDISASPGVNRVWGCSPWAECSGMSLYNRAVCTDAPTCWAFVLLVHCSCWAYTQSTRVASKRRGTPAWLGPSAAIFSPGFFFSADWHCCTPGDDSSVSPGQKVVTLRNYQFWSTGPTLSSSPEPGTHRVRRLAQRCSKHVSSGVPISFATVSSRWSFYRGGIQARAPALLRHEKNRVRRPQIFRAKPAFGTDVSHESM